MYLLYVLLYTPGQLELHRRLETEKGKQTNFNWYSTYAHNFKTTNNTVCWTRTHAMNIWIQGTKEEYKVDSQIRQDNAQNRKVNFYTNTSKRAMGADATNRQVYTTRIQSIKNRTHSIPILTMLELHFPLYTHFNRLVINNKWLMINEGGGGGGWGRL